MNLTKKDLDQMEVSLESKLVKTFTKMLTPIVNKLIDIEQDLQDVKQRTYLLPTIEEFFSRMDETMNELKTTREEHAALQAQVSRHTDDIADLQIIHPHNMHAVV